MGRKRELPIDVARVIASFARDLTMLKKRVYRDKYGRKYTRKVKFTPTAYGIRKWYKPN